MGERVWARRPMEYAGLMLARGEVFELGGHLHDEKLVRLRFVEKVARNAKLYEHGTTGRKFIEAGFLEAFGRADAQRQADLAIESAGEGLYGFVETTGDAELRRLNQEAPLALDKTKASQQ